jgi:hypothetical protein
MNGLSLVSGQAGAAAHRAPARAPARLDAAGPVTRLAKAAGGLHAGKGIKEMARNPVPEKPVRTPKRFGLDGAVKALMMSSPGFERGKGVIEMAKGARPKPPTPGSIADTQARILKIAKADSAYQGGRLALNLSKDALAARSA